MRIIARLLCLLFLVSCGAFQEQSELKNEAVDTLSGGVFENKHSISDTAADGNFITEKFEVVCFQNDSNAGGWGFDVYVDGKRYIHQPTVPVVSGVYGFRTKAQSEMAGKMMVEKLKQGKMPPALDESDLRLLGIRLQ